MRFRREVAERVSMHLADEHGPSLALWSVAGMALTWLGIWMLAGLGWACLIAGVFAFANVAYIVGAMKRAAVAAYDAACQREDDA